MKKKSVTKWQKWEVFRSKTGTKHAVMWSQLNCHLWEQGLEHIREKLTGSNQSLLQLFLCSMGALVTMFAGSDKSFL